MIDTDTTPDAPTSALLDDLARIVAGLPTAPERCWAWARIGHDVAAAEIARTPAGDSTSNALFGYGALLDAMSDLEGCGVVDCVDVSPLSLDRLQARRLLPHVMERVLRETVDPTSPAMRAAMSVIRQDVADCYVALTGHLPDRDRPHV